MTKLVALTGGIGSGKSTVARLFAELGATLLDADAIVHELQRKGEPLLDEIAAAFGPDVIDASGELDREALGAIVFRDEDARKRLNALVHPKVGVEFGRRLAAARERGDRLVVLDIPLLFENRRAGKGGASLWDFDATVVVYVREETQLERTTARDGCTREEAMRRVRAQVPIEEKKGLADHVIDNTGDRSQTERQVRALYERFTGEAAP